MNLFSDVLTAVPKLNLPCCNANLNVCVFIPSFFAAWSTLITHHPFYKVITTPVGIEPTHHRVKVYCLTAWLWGIIWAVPVKECYHHYSGIGLHTQPLLALSFSVRCPALAHIIRVLPDLVGDRGLEPLLCEESELKSDVSAYSTNPPHSFACILLRSQFHYIRIMNLVKIHLKNF